MILLYFLLFWPLRSLMIIIVVVRASFFFLLPAVLVDLDGHVTLPGDDILKGCAVLDFVPGVLEFFLYHIRVAEGGGADVFSVGMHFDARRVGSVVEFADWVFNVQAPPIWFVLNEIWHVHNCREIAILAVFLVEYMAQIHLQTEIAFIEIDVEMNESDEIGHFRFFL